MINEVRKQLNEIPGLREGKEGVRGDSTRCVSISTAAAMIVSAGTCLPKSTTV